MEMKMFMLKALILAGLMFISVLFGMQKAHEGINNMKGYNDPNFTSAFTISENQEGKLEASVLGNEVSAHDLEQKKKQLEEMKAFNLFSSAGKKLGEGISTATQKVLESISKKVNE